MVAYLKILSRHNFLQTPSKCAGHSIHNKRKIFSLFLINKMCLWCPWIMACNLGANIWFTAFCIVCYQCFIRSTIEKVFIDKTKWNNGKCQSNIISFLQVVGHGQKGKFLMFEIKLIAEHYVSNVLNTQSILNYGFILKCSQTLRR